MCQGILYMQTTSVNAGMYCMVFMMVTPAYYVFKHILCTKQNEQKFYFFMLWIYSSVSFIREPRLINIFFLHIHNMYVYRN